MVHVFTEHYPDSWRYWADCEGGGKIDEVEGLPEELQGIYKALWVDKLADKMWAGCYLIEVDGRYFVGLLSDYDRTFIEDNDMDYEKLVEREMAKARALARLRKCEVTLFADGNIIELFLLVPWDCSEWEFGYIAGRFDSLCYLDEIS